MRWFFLFTLLFITACKKKDELAPEIRISQPLNLTGYNLYNTVHIQGTVTDDRKLEFVTLQIVDNTMLPVTVIKSYTPSDKQFTINTGFFLEDIHLESGVYFIKIKASDGEHEVSEFVEINITGVAKTLKEILVVNAIAGQYYVNSIDSLDQLNQEFIIGNEFLDININSYDQLIAISGTTNETYRVIDWISKSINWEITALQNPPFVYFNAMSYNPDKRHFYISTSTGQKYIKNKTGGSVILSGIYQSMYQPFEVGFGVDYFLVDEFNAGMSSHHLVKYNYTTGNPIQNISIPFNMTHLIQGSIDEFFVFGNQSGVAKMYRYNVSGNSIWEPYTFTEVLKDVVKVSNNIYYLAMGSGLYQYTVGNNSLIPVNTAIVIDKMEFDQVNNQIYCLNTSGIQVLSVAGTIIRSIPVTNAISVGLLYNK